MLFPRLFAFAELAWTMPERKVWEDFKFKRFGPGSSRIAMMGCSLLKTTVSCWWVPGLCILAKISHEGGIPIDQAVPAKEVFEHSQLSNPPSWAECQKKWWLLICDEDQWLSSSFWNRLKPPMRLHQISLFILLLVGMHTSALGGRLPKVGPSIAVADPWSFLAALELAQVFLGKGGFYASEVSFPLMTLLPFWDFGSINGLYWIAAGGTKRHLETTSDASTPLDQLIRPRPTCDLGLSVATRAGEKQVLGWRGTSATCEVEQEMLQKCGWHFRRARWSMQCWSNDLFDIQ